MVPRSSQVSSSLAPAPPYSAGTVSARRFARLRARNFRRGKSRDDHGPRRVVQNPARQSARALALTVLAEKDGEDQPDLAGGLLKFLQAAETEGRVLGGFSGG